MSSPRPLSPPIDFSDGKTIRYIYDDDIPFLPIFNVMSESSSRSGLDVFGFFPKKFIAPSDAVKEAAVYVKRDPFNHS